MSTSHLHNREGEDVDEVRSSDDGCGDVDGAVPAEVVPQVAPLQQHPHEHRQVHGAEQLEMEGADARVHLAPVEEVRENVA